MNRVFQLKLGLIALGLINIAVFEIFITPKVKHLPPSTPLPSSARASAVTSIAIWIAVAICGRTDRLFLNVLRVHRLEGLQASFSMATFGSDST